MIFLEIKKWYFWAKKLMEIWYLLITEKFLFWSFREWEIRSFFQPRSWWKDDIYWLLRSSCFELFGDGKYGLFFSQKVDGKMIFTWSFWAFHNIPGLGKYCFSCSAVFKDQAKFDTQNLVISSLLTQIEISKKQKEKEIQKQ